MAELEKRFDLAQERKIYENWEKKGFFRPEVNENKGKGAYCIIMPPPNANGNLHLGHALMATVEDILVRYNRMLGKKTLYLPGADHAGFETQVVYEKVLEKEGKSRFDFDRDTLYRMIWDFTQANKSNMEDQLRALGTSCDWSREKFTLDPDIVATVHKIFKKMYDEGLIYRGNRIVNWDPFHQTGFSELEIDHKECQTQLVYIRYQIKDSDRFITVATTRPETMLGDTAIAVNPTDPRFKNLIGEIAVVPIVEREIPIVGDEAVETEFGTGAVKVTPAHDPVDFEIGERHNLPYVQVIDKQGRMTPEAGEAFAGLKTKEARAKVIENLQEKGLVDKIEELTHNVSVCYKCGREIEPLITEQWFVDTKELARRAIRAVEEGKTQFVTERYEKIYFQWMEKLKDWNISRQIVWGIQIPAWFCDCGEIIVTGGETPNACPKCGSQELRQDPDTFDTWFSSAQWPYATLGWPEGRDFKEFYPTDVMETGWDILPFWVARMMMMGLYTADEVPFKTIYLHGLVRDKHGRKMSKSKGNVVNPMEILEKYGTDALRFSLVTGAATGQDLNFMEEKVKGNRNFTTKLWNIARFVQMNAPENIDVSHETLTVADKWILGELEELKSSVTSHLDKFNLNLAAEAIHEFTWSKLADWYLEASKYYLAQEETAENTKAVLRHVLAETMKLLHPFMPFVTEGIWKGLNLSGKALIVETWPKSQKIEKGKETFALIQELVAETRNAGLGKEDTFAIDATAVNEGIDGHLGLAASLGRIKEIILK